MSVPGCPGFTFTIITNLLPFLRHFLSFLHRNSNNEYLGKMFDTISYLMFHVMSQGMSEDVRVCPTTQSKDLQEGQRAMIMLNTFPLI